MKAMKIQDPSNLRIIRILNNRPVANLSHLKFVCQKFIFQGQVFHVQVKWVND